ncbi:flagellin N-terminal helical domain-containing protein [Allorhizobium borbori]|uniref:Flagellin n=1 Tax=Allorhizobium borbori TaxID=485907 RepID=A0A7W6P380_9HYPH|nr:flagellin [Allorhizobium borbori]MBB4104589.1 flagellin [Allorhizobium borbori]
MTSINTNTSAMSALQTLRAVNSSLENTQNRVSSGYRIAEAKDNAAYWSIATTMRSDNGAVNAATDALGVGAAKVDVAYAAIESAIDVVNEIKTKLVSLNESTVDDDKVWDEVKQLQSQLVSIANSASFNGENWMLGATGTNSVVTAFVRTSGSGVTVTTETVTTGSFALFGKNATTGMADTASGVLKDIAAFTSASLASGAVAASLSTVETALKALTTGGSVLGSISKRIDLQTEFSNKLSDAIESGVSKLVDADMEEESAKLSALQTQQQLAVQSLSIANSSSQNILSLFRS